MLTKLRRSWLVTAIAGALLILSVASAIVESRRALEYREITSAATQAELAAHTLSMIELIDEQPPGIALEQADAIELLTDGAVFERSGLSPTEVDRAVELTMSLTENAQLDTQTCLLYTSPSPRD